MRTWKERDIPADYDPVHFFLAGVVFFVYAVQFVDRTWGVVIFLEQSKE